RVATNARAAEAQVGGSTECGAVFDAERDVVPGAAREVGNDGRRGESMWAADDVERFGRGDGGVGGDDEGARGGRDVRL
ncbi:MAG: hypothetical protein LQ347_006681, partial [Umbilicaria vellea]